MTLAAITTVAVSLFLLGGVMVLSEIVNQVTGEWEGKVELNVFLREDITPEQTKELQSSLTGMPEVEKVFYVSKEEAFNEYKEMFKDSPTLTENVSASVMPANFRIKLVDPNKAEPVKTRIDGRPGVDEVTFGGDAVKKLLRLTNVINTVVFTFTLILLSAAVLLIANTIRLAIYARRTEIGIMKLVGATNWFVRVPFIFEGVAEAALGAFLAGAVIFAGKLFALDRIQQSIPFLPLTVGTDDILRVFAVLMGVGAVIGALGSSLALRRFLEV
jgi:cell division transport system permease protein